MAESLTFDMFLFCVFVVGNCRGFDAELAGSHTVTVGQSVTLPCRTTLNTTVDWTFRTDSNNNTKPMTVCAVGIVTNNYVDRFTIVSTQHGDYSLRISSVTTTDSGVYTCIEDNGFGKQQTHHLNVVECNAITVVRGDQVTLPCMTTLNTTVDWKFRAIDSTTEGYRCALGEVINAFKDRFTIVSTHHGEYSLRISNTVINDSGVYICVEDNGFGQRHEHQLNVVVEVIGEGRSSDTVAGLVIGVVIVVIIIAASVAITNYVKQRRARHQQWRVAL